MATTKFRKQARSFYINTFSSSPINPHISDSKFSTNINRRSAKTSKTPIEGVAAFGPFLLPSRRFSLSSQGIDNRETHRREVTSLPSRKYIDRIDVNKTSEDYCQTKRKLYSSSFISALSVRTTNFRHLCHDYCSRRQCKKLEVIDVYLEEIYRRTSPML